MNLKTRRTTVRIKRGVFRKAREAAIEKGTSFQEVVNEALERYLNGKSYKEKTPLRLSVKRLGLPRTITRAYVYENG